MVKRFRSSPTVLRRRGAGGIFVDFGLRISHSTPTVRIVVGKIHRGINLAIDDELLTHAH
jgi:hypothetical protein